MTYVYKKWTGLGYTEYRHTLSSFFFLFSVYDRRARLNTLLRHQHSLCAHGRLLDRRVPFRSRRVCKKNALALARRAKILVSRHKPPRGTVTATINRYEYILRRYMLKVVTHGVVQEVRVVREKGNAAISVPYVFWEFTVHRYTPELSTVD